MNRRAGKFVKNLSGDAAYQSFKPIPLQAISEINIDRVMLNHLIRANRKLAELDIAAKLIPSVPLFVSMYVRKEALLSSQIEGTQCTLDDVLDPDSDQNANLDVKDVVNYVKAVNYAIERMETLPLCKRYLREVHGKLLEGVRGQDKMPGEYRVSQNWIGPANCSLKDARYIPPNVEDMNQALNELEEYFNMEREEDILICAALIHYQFETIHPFLDGNGRVGRLLILIYLMSKGLLNQPVIYISHFLKKNQIEYYDRMSEVRRSGNYEQWINFFLEALYAAAKDSLEMIQRLASLHDRNIEKIPKTNRSKDNLRALFDYIEQHPIMDIKRTADALHLSYNTVAAGVKNLQQAGILSETTNASRNRVFAYEDYLQILRKDT